MAGIPPIFDGHNKANQKRCQHHQGNFDRHEERIEVDRRAPEWRTAEVVFVQRVADEIARVNQKLATHVRVQVMPNLGQQDRGVRNQENDKDQDVEIFWDRTAGLARLPRPYVKPMMIESVEPEVVRKIL